MSRSQSITTKSEFSQALAVLNKIGRSLIDVHDASKALNQIAKDAKAVLGADIVDLYEYIQIRNEFVLPPILVGKRRNPYVPKDKIYDDDVVVKVVKTGKPQYFPDARNTTALIKKFDISREDAPDKRFVIREGVVSSVSLPLKAGEETVGVMFVNFRTQQTFNDEQKNLIESFSNFAAIAIRNARILEDLQHRVRGHEALNQIGDKLSGLLDETEILGEIVRFANKALDCMHCTVFRLQGERLVIAATEGKFAQSLKPGRTFNLGQGIAGWVAQHGKAALVMNTLSDERYELGWHDTEDGRVRDDQNEPGSLIVVPILLNKVVYGVISIEQRYIASYTPLDQEFLEILARQASSAIENARLVKRLQSLNKISREISSKLDVQAILGCVVDAVVEEFLDCNHCTFFVEENNLLVPRAFYTKNEQKMSSRSFKVGEGLVGQVAQSGQSMLMTGDALNEKGFSKGLDAPQVTNRSMILVSVKTAGEIYGVISVNQDRLNAFIKQDLEMVETLALQVGIAIENAKLLEQRTFLQNISLAINAALNIDDSLKLIVEGARKLTGANAGIVHLINTEKMEISRSYAYPPEGGSQLPSRFARKKGFTWEIYNTGKLVIASDLEKSKLANEEGIKLGIRALIGIPLKIDTKVVGVLFLNDIRTREFSLQEKELLSLLANTAAVAVERTRLNQDLQSTNARLGVSNSQLERVNIKLGEANDNLITANNELYILNKNLEYVNSLLETKNRNLNAVIDMGKYLTASVDLSEKQVLHLIYEKLNPLMNTENMYIALYDHATDMVRFPVMFVDGKETQVPVRKAGSGRTEYIISTKNSLFIQTREESITWYKQQGRMEYIQEPFASWIGVPMISGDRPIGVIATFHKTKDYEYDQDDLEVLQAIANQAAIALEVTQRVTELKTLQYLTQDLSAGLL